MAVDAFELILVFAAKVAERDVIDRASRAEPNEVDRMSYVVFDLATASDASNEGKEEDFAEHRGMDRRLPEGTVIFGFPMIPIEPAEDFIEDPHGMIVRDS